MAKVKYRYNSETLSYDKVVTSVREKLKTAGVMFAVSILMTIVYYMVYSYFYNTPKERALSIKLENVTFNYQMLNQELNRIDDILSNIQKRDDNIYRTVLESEPIPLSMRLAGFGGINRYESLDGYANSGLLIETSKHVDKILMQLYIQSLSYDELIIKAKSKEEMAVCRPAIQPVSNKELKYVASGYGMRTHPVSRVRKFHEGIDFAAPIGSDIYSTGDGIVTKAEYSGGYGLTVVVDHGFGYKTLYAHMSKVSVVKGSAVKRGQIIGSIGNTGTSTGPHLHYEVHKNNKTVNPVEYFNNELSPEEYVRMVELSNSGEVFEKW